MFGIPLLERFKPRQFYIAAAQRWLIAILFGVLLGAGVLILMRVSLIAALGFYLACLGGLLVLITGHLRHWLIFLAIIEIPVRLEIFLLGRTELIKYGTISGFSLSASTVAILLLYLLWITEILLTRKPSFRNPKPLINIGLICFLITGWLSMLASVDRLTSLYELIMHVQTFLLFIYLVGWIKTDSDIKFIIFCTMWALMYACFGVVFQILTGTIISPNAGGLILPADSSRGAGAFGSPNAAGTYFLLMLGLAYGALLADFPDRWLKRLVALASAVGTLGLVLSYSRGAWIGFVMLLLVFGYFMWRRNWLPIRVLQYLSIALVVVAVVFQNAILQRILGPDQGAAESRLPLNQLALNIIADHPIIGVGANNYATVMVDYLGPEFTGEWIFTVHNRYLLIWAEAGFLGLLSWLAFLGLTIYYGYQCWRLNDRFYSILGLGAVAGILAHMLHMTYDIFNARTLFQPLLTNAAFITAIALVGAQQLRARKANAALPSLPTETLPTNDPTTNRHVRPSSWSVR